jgi:hypothetical protein
MSAHETPTIKRYIDKFCVPKVKNLRSPIGVAPKINLLRYAVFADQLELAGCVWTVSWFGVYFIRDSSERMKN